MINKVMLQSVFEKIDQAQTLNDLHKIKEFDIQIAKKEDKYPKVDMKFTKEEIDEISEILLKFKEGKVSFNKNPLAKLLYSYIWKQGGHKKLLHIADGINGIEIKNKKSGFVLTQFGRSISNENEPIIDQHVIRAYQYLKSNFENSKLDSIKKGHIELIDQYKNWLESTSSRIKGNKQEILTRIDDLMFSLGKELKK